MDLAIAQDATSSFKSGLLVSSAIGYALSIFTSLGLLIHIAYHKIINSHNEEQRDQTGYILIMVYYASLLVTGCIYSFVTSNFLTGSHPSDFTEIRCLVGTISAFLFMTFNVILLNIILLLRIYYIFKGSMFAYKSLLV